MENKKNKILVLLDLKEASDSLLKSAIKLAKIVKADIDLFYVKKPIDVVKKESQLSAMRTINREYATIDKKIKTMVAPYVDDQNVKINTAFTFGNIKKEITNHIAKINPDILVIGKRKNSPLKFVGDKLTEFILTNYQGTLLIDANRGSFESNEDLELGAFNISNKELKDDLSKEIIKRSKAPLKSFKVVEKSILQKEVVESVNSNSVVEYVFEQNDNSLDNLSNYLTKSNVNLLLVEREANNDSSRIVRSQLKELINKSNISMLLPGIKKFELN